MTTLAELKAKSQANLAKFKEKSQKPVFERKVDERYWYPKRDEHGNGFAIIRFLPIPPVDDSDERALPWVKIFSHSFKHPTTQKWYIENSLTTFGEKDPLGEYNSRLYNSGDEEKKKQASRQKRKTQYVSNIYVVRDPAAPENEGKVFLYSYGVKIYEKILAQMNPDEAFGEEPVDPFNFWTGRNFRMKIKTIKSGDSSFPNYDSSEWDSIGPISDKSGRPLTDEEIEEVYQSEYSLLELIDRKHFKTYDELKKRLMEVIGDDFDENEDGSTKKKTETKTETKFDDDDDDDVVSKLLEDSGSSENDDTDDLIDQWINED